MSFAVGLRQTCRRSFATSARLQQDNAELMSILKHQTVAQKKREEKQAAGSADGTRYHTFYADQFLNPGSLSYKACTRARPKRRALNIAPTASAARQKDIFYNLDLDPRDFTNNPAILYDFVTDMGKIKSRTQTELTVKTQRLLGKTIRRAKIMGIVPMLSK